MFKFLKKDKSKTDKKPSEQPKESRSWLNKLQSGLSKTRQKWGNSFANLLLGKKTIDSELEEAIENILLTSDVGFHTTQAIIEKLKQALSRKELKDERALFETLEAVLIELLQSVQSPLEIQTSDKPFCILLIGTNGSGKTTTIGKLAHQYQSQGLSVMLAAGDTFRAAAIDQLKVWGERNQIPVIAQNPGADSASVIFDGLESAKARNVDVLLADTAGRLHTQHNLMEELKKIVRVTKKVKTDGPDEILLVLDAGFGQNALQQAKQYDEAIGIDGIVLTKLDGTAKGGIIFSLAEELGKPIRYIGVGEGLEDLQPFEPEAFVKGLLEPIDEGS